MQQGPGRRGPSALAQCLKVAGTAGESELAGQLHVSSSSLPGFHKRLLVMTTSLLLELFGGFAGACFALWLISQSLPAPRVSLLGWLIPFKPGLLDYLQRPGMAASVGLLLLRLSIGVMMIHHGQEKLADPQQFADTYVASLHLPFPLVFAYVAGFSELIGSWLVILGLLTPLGALALTATMATAAYQHILTAGLNIYVLELVVLYLGGSLALLLNGPGRFSFDAGMGPELIASLDRAAPAPDAAWPSSSGTLTSEPIPVEAFERAG
jgi:putative oxidoreductase